MKCAKCGARGIGLWRRGWRFLDGKYACMACVEALGFERSFFRNPCAYYNFENVKDGLDAYYERSNAAMWQRSAAEARIPVRSYKQMSAAGATSFEERFFARMCALLDDEGCSPERLDIASGENGSLLVLLDGTVVCEFKGERDVKWIRFPGEEKIRVGNSAKLNSLAGRLVDSYRSAL